MPHRRCLNCAALTTNGTRCPDCQTAHNRQQSRRRDATRPTPAQRGYDTQHQHDRAALLATNPPCHWCGQPNATIADHIGNRADRNYVPACPPCNARRITRPNPQPPQ